MIIEDVAKLLGVSLEEEFKINDYEGKFKLTKDGLKEFDGDEWYQNNELDTLLVDLLTGGLSITIEPFKPVYGSIYYYPSTFWRSAESAVWKNSPVDFALLNAGMVFRNKDKCLYKLNELKEKWVKDENSTDEED